MGIFSRLGEIVNANLSSMLDKAENPEKMIRLMIHEMEDTLTEVKSSAAEVIADRIRTERALRTINENIREWEERAELAVGKGRDDLARVALERKLVYMRKSDEAKETLKHVEEMGKQYQDDIARLEDKLQGALRRQKELALKKKRAENSKKLEERLYQANTHAFDKFEAYAEKVDRLEADSEVHTYGQGRNLEQEFRELAQNGDIDKELQKLKSKKKSSDK